MDFRLIQDAERQMLRDGKSAAAIDAMKSAYRKQMFNPDGYSRTAGLGSFASGGEAYGPPPVKGPVPQGIASFQDGGEAESFFSRFNPLTGSYRKKKPLSVRAAETAIDFTPLAAVRTGQEIYEESQSEDPSLLKMGIMAAGEAAGLIPIAGPAVKTMVRRVPADLADDIAGLNRRSIDTEINNYRLNLERNTDLSPDEIDVRVENYAANQEGAVSGAVRELTDTERLADEIAADLRAGNTDLVTDERLEELDFLGEIRLRQHYIDGNVGVDADGIPITLDNAEREARMLAQGYERVGVHGTMPTQEGVSVDDIRVLNPSTYGKSGRGVYLDVEPTGMNFGDGEIVNPSGIPYPTANRFAGYNPDPRSIDRGKGAADRIPEGSQMYPLVQRGPFAKSTDYTAARRELLQQNPDLDTVELDRLANQRLMDQGFAGVDSTHYGEITSFEGGNLRSPTAIFDPRLTDLKNIGMADGGAVMSGIGTLNETARNMTRGPRGIGAYQQFVDGGAVPRQTMINNQPHMLAYINPEEEQMLLENGGAGLPGPGGVPAYWKLFEPSTWAGGSNYTPGAGFEGFTSSSAPETSIRPRMRPANLAPPVSSDNGGGSSAPAANVVQPKPEPEPQGILAAAYGKAKDFFNPNSQATAAMRGSGIMGNPDDPRNQGLTMFPGPISLGLKGLAYLGGIRKTDPIVKVTDDKNVYQTGSGSFYVINSVTGLPMMVESPDDLSLSSAARERMDAMMKDMNKSDNESGPGSCGPGYVYDYGAGACVPMIGTAATSASDVLYADDFTPAGGNTLVPDPEYLPVGMAEGGIVNISGSFGAYMPQLPDMSRLGVLGFPGGPPMGSPVGQTLPPALGQSMFQRLPPASGQSMFQGHMGDLMNRPNMGQHLQQYGQYLERQYGDPDFEQKRDQFLREVSQKEQQTFQDNAGVFQDSLFSGMHQPTNFPDFSTDLSSVFNEHFGQIKNPSTLQSFALQSFADGGPVYMEKGGSSEVASRRASTEDLANLAKMVRETYGFDPVAVALEQGIDPELALRVMYEESKGNQSAGSEKGARGLMQLMPGTAEELGVDINDALDNYTGGLKYLKQMTDQFGLEVGLAAYNAGPGNVEEYQGVPPFEETQNYLRIIAEPFTGNSVEGLINTGAENFIMNQPVFNAEDVARGRGVRPMSRPPEIEFSAPATSLRPMARPEELIEPELEQIDVSLQPSRQNLMEKYSLANMAEALTQQEPVGIMSATR